MDELRLDSAATERIVRIAAKYFWWTPPGGGVHALSRQIAQIMHLGTYEDVLQLESLLTTQTLAGVMTSSEPGWFDDRSWEFWRGRLTARGAAWVPWRRPARQLADA